MLQIHLKLEELVSRVDLISLLAERFGVDGDLEESDWPDLVDPLTERMKRLNARCELYLSDQAELIDRAPEEILAISECIGLINSSLKEQGSKARIVITWEN